MNWIRRKRQATEVKRDERFASAADIHQEFDSQSERLHWLAQVITGDADLAKECVIDARNLSSKNSSVFRDWLTQWAVSATIRSAIEFIREEIIQSAARYSGASCRHGGHEPLTRDQVEALRQMDSQQIASALDPFSRTVLIVRGVQHAAIQDCALTLAVPRSAVVAAFCEVSGWLQSEQSSERMAQTS